MKVETSIEPYQGVTDGKEVSIEKLESIKASLECLIIGIDQLTQLHKVRVRQTEEGSIVIFHCRVEPGLTVFEAHQAVDEFEHRIRQEHPDLWRIVGHAEPKKPFKSVSLGFSS